MEGLASNLIAHYGPLALGWVVAGVLTYFMLSERKKPTESAGVYQKVLDDYHDAIVAVTKALEHLATLIEERTRK